MKRIDGKFEDLWFMVDMPEDGSLPDYVALDVQELRAWIGEMFDGKSDEDVAKMYAEWCEEEYCATWIGVTKYDAEKLKEWLMEDVEC